MKKILITISVITIAFLSCKKDKKETPKTAPVVTTAAVTNITINSATGGGSIVSDGGAVVTKSGVLWSKTNNTPTFADSVVAGTTANGIFTSNITGLDFNNTYYVRAFAINSVDTAFGNVVSFSTVNDDTKVRFIYNGQEVTYGIIVSQVTGKKWLDRNLGASQVATAYDDYKAYGDLFQWGRPADGHQLMNWTASNAGTPVNGISTELATSDTPGNKNFIMPPYAFPLDWRSDNNTNRWATNPQGPCPTGWHVPTIDEWKKETGLTAYGGTTGGFTDRNGAYSLLKLTVAGCRQIEGPGPDDVHLIQMGGAGHYWSSSEAMLDYANEAYKFNPGSDYVQTGPEFMAFALSVRCLKDN